MGRRRRKRRRTRVAVAVGAAGAAGAARPGVESGSRIPALVPWRQRFEAAQRALRTWVHDHHAATVEAYLTQAFGDASLDADDRERLVDAFVCAPGSAPDGRSLVRACAVDCKALDDEGRDQLLRWERECRRGVFIIQRAHADAFEAWDPLEGAPLTLHLLHRPTEREQACAVPGTVITATFRPWLARLVVVPAPEYFPGDEATPLFRREVEQSGATWHPVPAAAPIRSSRR